MAVLANELRLRRGTEEQHKSFVGSVGEVTVVTTEDSSENSPAKYILSVHDGKTPGGHFLAGRDYVNNELDNVRKRFDQIDNRIKDELLTRSEADLTYMRRDAKFTEESLPESLKERFDELFTDMKDFNNFRDTLSAYDRPSGATHIGYTASAEYFDLRDESEINEDSYEPTIKNVQEAIDAIASWYKNLAKRIDDGVIDQKINEAINKLIDGAPEALDTLKEIADLLGNNKDFVGTVIGRLEMIQRGVVNLNSKDGAKVELVGKLGKLRNREYSVSASPIFKGFNEDGSIINEGTIGEIWIKKDKDSFTIYNTGPAKGIDVEYIIIGEVGE